MFYKTKNYNGHIQLAVLGVVVVGIIGLVGAMVMHVHNQKSTELKLADNKTTNYKSLNKTDIANLKATPAPAPTPQPSPLAPAVRATPSPQPTPVTSVGSPTSRVPSTYANWKVNFSADGCYVTIVADPGVAIEIGAHTATKGGSVQYTMPASGTLTKSSGGFSGMISYGKASASSGGVYSESTITANQCAPAG